jgi:hypothetical protein
MKLTSYQAMLRQLRDAMPAQLPLRAGITVTCVVLAVLHRLWPDIAKDPVTLALLALALLPWLQPIFKTIKLPGGIEITLQDMERKIDAAAGAAASASRKADLAVSGITPKATAAPVRETAITRETALADLARQYDQIRETQDSGPARTSAMTAVVRQMIQHGTGLTDAELRTLLKSDAGGERLVAYASLYGSPQPSLLEPLVASVTKLERKPFGQYWGLQAIGKNLPKKGSDIPHAVIEALTVFESRQRPGTDRHYALTEIFRQVRGENSN